MRIIGGTLKGRKIHPPVGIKARPTTDMARESLFNILGNITSVQGANVLDLFCGTGAVSLEFLSRGAARVISIDIESSSKTFIESVARAWDLPNLRVVKADVFRLSSKANETFDIVFADPPYGHHRFGEIPQMVLGSGWVKPGGWFILEHGKGQHFEQMPGFVMERKYGSVHFSFFSMAEP